MIISISLLKEAGHPMRPMGLVVHWNCPIPGMVKAVYGRLFGSNAICQNPEDKSRHENTLESA